AESQAQSCDFDQAQAIARVNCKGQDPSFCKASCTKLSSALVAVEYGCEQNPNNEADYYCVCCYAMDLCDSAGSNWFPSFSPKLLLKGLRQ
ncbi:hypothetical protein MKW94_011641, partial [Papaver nudicaule]|nr:hypothetical protein [Papaver nudicaule]